MAAAQLAISEVATELEHLEKALGPGTGPARWLEKAVAKMHGCYEVGGGWFVCLCVCLFALEVGGDRFVCLDLRSRGGRGWFVC